MNEFNCYSEDHNVESDIESRLVFTESSELSLMVY